MTDLKTQYQIKTELEHILAVPAMYIGPVAAVDADMWVYDDATQRIVLRTIELIPGLYKLYDECAVNARDQILRMISFASPR